MTELRGRARPTDMLTSLAAAPPGEAVSLAVGLARAVRRRAWRTAAARRSGLLSGVRRGFQADLGCRFAGWVREGGHRIVLGLDGGTVVEIARIEVPMVRCEDDLEQPFFVTLLRPDLLDYQARQRRLRRRDRRAAAYRRSGGRRTIHGRMASESDRTRAARAARSP